MNVQEKLDKLEARYQKKKDKILKKCKHQWKEDGYESDKYSGTQYYKCIICGDRKGESF